jgi:hypothetical protein
LGQLTTYFTDVGFHTGKQGKRKEVTKEVQVKIHNEKGEKE